jgi:hypothetical protein
MHEGLFVRKSQEPMLVGRRVELNVDIERVKTALSCPRLCKYVDFIAIIVPS